MSLGGIPTSPTTQSNHVVITTAAGTLANAPQVDNISFGDVLLVSVQVIVPPGPSGALGIALFYNGQLYVPWQGSSPWLIFDNANEIFDVNAEVDTKLQIKSYNTGFWPHSSYWIFRYKPMSAASASVPQFINVGA